MSRREVKTAANGFSNAVARKVKGNVRYATVTSVTADDKGATNLVNVVIDNGTPKQNVPSGFNLTEGARVRLRSDGLSGSESFVVDSPIRAAPSERGNNPNAIIETPIIAGFKHYQRQLQGGVIVLYIVVMVWQIKAQWRDGVAVGYELEMRQVTGDMPSQTIPKAPQGQLKVKLDGGIDDDDTTIQVEAVGGNVPAAASQLPPRFGYISFEDNQEVAYYDTYVPNDYFSGVLREQDTPEGLPTTATSHADGMLVRGRSVAFALSDLPTDTNHEYRVRAVIGQQKSNWSDWEIYKTPANTPADQRTADLISNGDFPTDTSDWSLGGVHSASLTHDATHGFMGLGCAKIEETGTGSPSNVQFRQMTISVTGGNEYVLQMNVAGDGDLNTDGTITVLLEFNSGDTFYRSPIVAATQIGLIDNNKWLLFEARGIAPIKATSVDVMLSAFAFAEDGGTAQLYIDDVRMIELPHSKSALVEESVEADGLKVGGGAGQITKAIVHKETWNPGSVVNDGYLLHEVTVTGALAGDVALAGFDEIAGLYIMLSATVIADDTVLVELTNREAAPTDLGSGTLTVTVFRGDV